MNTLIRTTRSTRNPRLLAVLVLVLFAQLSIIAHDLSHETLNLTDTCEIFISQDHNGKTCETLSQTFEFQTSPPLLLQRTIDTTSVPLANDHNPRAPPYIFFS